MTWTDAAASARATIRNAKGSHSCGTLPRDADAGTDAEVILASLKVPEEFEAIFVRHFDAIYAYVGRRAGREVADTVASETFCVAFGGRGRFNAAYVDARPWLYGIATNLLRKHWRNERRRTASTARLRELFGRGSPTSNPVEELDSRWLSDDVREALAALSANDRDVLLLYAWADLSYAEISHAIGCPVGTVQSRLHRARRIVRTHLGESATEQARCADAGSGRAKHG